MLVISPSDHSLPALNGVVPATPYEADALAFCRDWLSGQDQFTLFTSGSTGTPKSIVLTRAQMRASALLTGQTLGLQPGDAALGCLNIRYVAGIMMLVRGLELGLAMTIIEPTSNPLADFSDTTPFDFTAFVPLQLQTILTGNKPANGVDKLPILNRMKAILVGGAATSPVLEQALQVITAPVYATYGMTETVSHIALRRLNGPDRSDLFMALEGVILGTDKRNCLHITSAATNFERIQTNDIADLINTSTSGPMQFRLLGRADSVINSGGVKVQPESVERVIQGVLSVHGPIPRLFVAGMPDDRLGQRVVLFLEKPVTDFESVESSAWPQIQEAVRETLGAYAVPKEFVLLPAFAETPTGKIDRSTTMTRMRYL